MVIPRFVERALAGEPLEVHGDGTQTRCFCHVARHDPRARGPDGRARALGRDLQRRLHRARSASSSSPSACRRRTGSSTRSSRSSRTTRSTARESRTCSTASRPPGRSAARSAGSRDRRLDADPRRRDRAHALEPAERNSSAPSAEPPCRQRTAGAAEPPRAVPCLRAGSGTSPATRSLRATRSIISIVAARFLGPEGMGRQSFIAFISITLTTVLSSSMYVAVMRYIGETSGRGRSELLPGLLWWAWRIEAVAALAGGDGPGRARGPRGDAERCLGAGWSRHSGGDPALGAHRGPDRAAAVPPSSRGRPRDGLRGHSGGDDRPLAGRRNHGNVRDRGRDRGPQPALDRDAGAQGAGRRRARRRAAARSSRAGPAQAQRRPLRAALVDRARPRARRRDALGVLLPRAFLDRLADRLLLDRLLLGRGAAR